MLTAGELRGNCGSLTWKKKKEQRKLREATICILFTQPEVEGNNPCFVSCFLFSPSACLLVSLDVDLSPFPLPTNLHTCNQSTRAPAVSQLYTPSPCQIIRSANVVLIPWPSCKLSSGLFFFFLLLFFWALILCLLAPHVHIPLWSLFGLFSIQTVCPPSNIRPPNLTIGHWISSAKTHLNTCVQLWL